MKDDTSICSINSAQSEHTQVELRLQRIRQKAGLISCKSIEVSGGRLIRLAYVATTLYGLTGSVVGRGGTVPRSRESSRMCPESMVKESELFHGTKRRFREEARGPFLSI